MEYCYRHHSTSSTVRDRLTEREILLQNIPRQEFELDLNERALSDDELHLRAVSKFLFFGFILFYIINKIHRI